MVILHFAVLKPSFKIFFPRHLHSLVHEPEAFQLAGSPHGMRAVAPQPEPKYDQRSGVSITAEERMIQSRIVKLGVCIPWAEPRELLIVACGNSNRTRELSGGRRRYLNSVQKVDRELQNSQSDCNSGGKRKGSNQSNKQHTGN